MKVKDTAIKLVQKCPTHLKNLDNKNLTGQDKVRDAITRLFKKLIKSRSKDILIPALGCRSGFPIVGAAKIMVQEIFQLLRRDNVHFNSITVCMDDPKNFPIYKNAFNGYVNHIRDGMGLGPYVTVDIIIERPEGIVIIERSNPPYSWALPGGFVDYGESLEHAAAREGKEETNLNLINLRQMRAYSDPSRDRRFHTIAIAFIAEGKGKPKSGDDAQNLKVVPYDQLLNGDYAFDHKKIIRDYLGLKDKENKI